MEGRSNIGNPKIRLFSKVFDSKGNCNPSSPSKYIRIMRLSKNMGELMRYGGLNFEFLEVYNPQRKYQD